MEKGGGIDMKIGGKIMAIIKRILLFTFFLFIVAFIMDFIWFYCFPVPGQNLSKSLLFSVKPGMTSEEVDEILGQPIKGYGSEGIREGRNILHHYYHNDFISMSRKYQDSVWIYSEPNYFKKSLGISIDFENDHVRCLVAKRNDVLYFLNCNDKRIIKDERKFSRYLNK